MEGSAVSGAALFFMQMLQCTQKGDKYKEICHGLLVATGKDYFGILV